MKKHVFPHSKHGAQDTATPGGTTQITTITGHINSTMNKRQRKDQTRGFSCDDWENICTSSYYHQQIGSTNYYPFYILLINLNAENRGFFTTRNQFICISNISLNTPIHNTFQNPSINETATINHLPGLVTLRFIVYVILTLLDNFAHNNVFISRWIYADDWTTWTHVQKTSTQ